MKKFKLYMKQIMNSCSNSSFKKKYGTIGFSVIMFVIIFCTITNTQAPVILETFIWAVCMLLCVDSITSVWKINKKE